MKKLAIIILIGFSVFSCKKEESKPSVPCNCGKIMSDNVANYSVDIKNDCTGNIKNFVLYEADWMTAYVGSNYCITNETKW
jgi:hypothetical protein